LTKCCNRFAVATLIAAAILAMPVTAFAAMDATLSSSRARPGDTVLLLTDDHKGTWNYKSLSSEDHQRIYLAPTTGNATEACGGPGSQLLGRLKWRGNAGGVVFVVPSLPSGDYWLFMETSHQCWRIAGATGATHEVLVLSVGNLPADNQEAAARWTRGSPTPPPPSWSATPWLAILGGCALVLLMISAVWWRLREPNLQSPDGDLRC
jgi:hypothetical protein